MNDIQQQIEALVFYRNEPVSYTWLARTLNLTKKTITEHIEDLAQYYVGRGMELVYNDDTVTLVTHRDVSGLLEAITKQESTKELSKQALETLAIILFKDQVAKSEIDYIRGVNSVYILRNLQIRGLIQKKNNPDNARAPFYIPTLDLLTFLGVQHQRELLDNPDLHDQLEKIHTAFLQDESNQADIAPEDDIQDLNGLNESALQKETVHDKNNSEHD